MAGTDPSSSSLDAFNAAPGGVAAGLHWVRMELVENRSSKTPAARLCDRLVTQAYYNGLLLLMCGQSTIRFMPPLMITNADVDEALTILTASLDEVLADDKKNSGAAVPAADAARS